MKAQRKKKVYCHLKIVFIFTNFIGVENGGKITDFHKTAKGTFAVHIETNDGLRHSYSSVSEKALQGVPGFNPVEE